jgi:translation initiation factor 4G
MDFATKNDLIQVLKGAKHFEKDFELLKKLFPTTKLVQQLRTSNEFTSENDDAKVLNLLFDNGVTELEVKQNRTPKAEEPKDDLLEAAKKEAEEKARIEAEEKARIEAEENAKQAGEVITGTEEEAEAKAKQEGEQITGTEEETEGIGEALQLNSDLPPVVTSEETTKKKESEKK